MHARGWKREGERARTEREREREVRIQIVAWEGRRQGISPYAHAQTHFPTKQVSVFVSGSRKELGHNHAHGRDELRSRPKIIRSLSLPLSLALALARARTRVRVSLSLSPSPSPSHSPSLFLSLSPSLFLSHSLSLALALSLFSLFSLSLSLSLSLFLCTRVDPCKCVSSEIHETSGNATQPDLYAASHVHLNLISITRSGDIFQSQPTSSAYAHARIASAASARSEHVPHALASMGCQHVLCFCVHVCVYWCLCLCPCTCLHVLYTSLCPLLPSLLCLFMLLIFFSVSPCLLTGPVHELASSSLLRHPAHQHHARPNGDYHILDVPGKGEGGMWTAAETEGGLRRDGGGGGRIPSGPLQGWGEIEDLGQGLLHSIGLGWRGGKSEGAGDVGGRRGDVAAPPTAGPSWMNPHVNAGRGGGGHGGGGGRDGDGTVTGVFGAHIHGGNPAPSVQPTITTGGGGGGGGGGSRGSGPGVSWLTEEHVKMKEVADFSGRDGWIPIPERGGEAMHATPGKRQVQMPSEHAHTGRALRIQEKWVKTRDACVALQKELQPSAFSFAPNKIAALAESVCSKVFCPVELTVERLARRERGGEKTGIEDGETVECVTCESSPAERCGGETHGVQRRWKHGGKEKRCGGEALSLILTRQSFPLTHSFPLTQTLRPPPSSDSPAFALDFPSSFSLSLLSSLNPCLSLKQGQGVEKARDAVRTFVEALSGHTPPLAPLPSFHRISLRPLPYLISHISSLGLPAFKEQKHLGMSLPSSLRASLD